MVRALGPPLFHPSSSARLPAGFKIFAQKFREVLEEIFHLTSSRSERQSSFGLNRSPFEFQKKSKEYNQTAKTGEATFSVNIGASMINHKS
jgi:hypothetical protein